jgi:asparagine synthase (glutamine-hydrolysing)
VTATSSAHETGVTTFGKWVATAGPRSEAIEVSGQGAKPVVASDAAGELLFDGVLSNAADLRLELGPFDREPESEAELVLAGFRRHGPEIVHRLRGQWLIVARDRGHEEVFCARDHYGLYGCFYAENDGALLVSPSVEALVRHPGVRGDLNRAALADHLCHRWPIYDETYYEAIRRLSGGHALTLRGGSKTVRRYWHLPPNELEEPLTPDEEQERFDELLDRAVSRCLFAPAAINLSGGLDSVSVAVVAADIAARRGEAPPQALSLVFEHESANEEEIQVAVARELGMEQTLVGLQDAVPSSGLLAAAVEMSPTMPAPLTNIWAPAYRYLGLEGRSRGCRLILTGNGGDEWLEFPVYESELLLKRGDVRGLYLALRSIERRGLISRREILRNLLWRYGTATILRRAASRTLRRVAPGKLAARRRERLDAETSDWIGTDPGLEAELFERYVAFADAMPDPLDSAYAAREFEEHFERARMLGLHTAHPLWDVDLTAFVERLPRSSLLRGGHSKAHIRPSLARRFPGLGFETQKKVGATTVYRSLLLGDGPRVWRQLGGAEALSSLGIVDAAKIERRMQQLFTGSEPKQIYWIWYILAIEAWLRPRVG